MPTITSFRWYLENRNVFVKTESYTNLVYTLHFKNLLIHNGFLYTILNIVKQIREVHKRNINNLETIYKQHSKTKSCTVQYFEFHSIILHKFIIFHNHFIDCLYNTFIAWSLFITITSHWLYNHCILWFVVFKLYV